MFRPAGIDTRINTRRNRIKLQSIQEVHMYRLYFLITPIKLFLSSQHDLQWNCIQLRSSQDALTNRSALQRSRPTVPIKFIRSLKNYSNSWYEYSLKPHEVMEQSRGTTLKSALQCCNLLVKSIKLPLHSYSNSWHEYSENMRLHSITPNAIIYTNE
jgi:hypothetical protein